MSRYQCWNCLTHHNGDYERCDNCISKGHDKPTNWRPGPNYVLPTNADRLRAMSDEELANEMRKRSISTICDIVCQGGCKAIATLNKTGNEACRGIIMKWLQQPAEVTNGR